MILTGVTPVLNSKMNVILWGGLYLLLALGLFSPFAMLSILGLMIPTLMLWMTLSPRQFTIIYLMTVLIVTLFLNGLGMAILLLVTLFFLFPAMAMGRMYQKANSARAAVTAGVFVFIGEMVLMIVLLSFMKLNVFELTKQWVWDGYKSLPAFWTQDVTDEMLTSVANLASAMIPTSMIAIAFFLTVIAHWTVKTLLKWQKVQLPSFSPVREWMLPKSLVWYYMGAMMLNLFFEFEQNSLFYLILVNMIPILAFAFAVQAIAFLFFIAYKKQWNAALPVIGIITFPLMSPYLSILGVFDVAFGLRKGFKN